MSTLDDLLPHHARDHIKRPLADLLTAWGKSEKLSELEEAAVRMAMRHPDFYRALDEHQAQLAQASAPPAPPPAPAAPPVAAPAPALPFDASKLGDVAWAEYKRERGL